MPNSITDATADVPIKELATMRSRLRAADYKVVEAAPALSTAYATNRNRAVALAHTYATTLKTTDEHRQLFQTVATYDEDTRKTLVEGYRKAGQTRGVVHAIGLLPRAQGQTFMRDLLVKDDGTVDRRSAREVGVWLRDAGAAMRVAAVGHQDDVHDDALVEFIEDVGDALSDAVTAVVDAVTAIADAIGGAIMAVVNWTVQQVQDLARALYNSFATLGELIGRVFEAGLDVLRTILRGLEGIGIAMRDVIRAALDLARDTLVAVLRAVDGLGRTLAQLLSTIAGAAFDLVKKAIDALLEIGKTIGNLIEQAAGIVGNLLRDTVLALIAARQGRSARSS